MFGNKKPKITLEAALNSKPLRLVETDMKPLGQEGGMLTVQLAQKKIGRWFFRLPAGAKKSYEFDTIGVFVWEQIDGKTSVEQIVKRLAKRYDLNLREAQVPTLKFLQMLIQRGLVGVPVEKQS